MASRATARPSGSETPLAWAVKSLKSTHVSVPCLNHRFSRGCRYLNESPHEMKNSPRKDNIRSHFDQLADDRTRWIARNRALR